MIDSKIIFWGIADGLCRAGDFGEGEASESVSASSVFHFRQKTRYARLLSQNGRDDIFQALLTNKSYQTTRTNKPPIILINTDTKKWAGGHSHLCP